MDTVQKSLISFPEVAALATNFAFDQKVGSTQL